MSAIPIEQYANDLIQSVIASAEAESLSGRTEIPLTYRSSRV